MDGRCFIFGDTQPRVPGTKILAIHYNIILSSKGNYCTSQLEWRVSLAVHSTFKSRKRAISSTPAEALLDCLGEFVIWKSGCKTFLPIICHSLPHLYSAAVCWPRLELTQSRLLTYQNICFKWWKSQHHWSIVTCVFIGPAANCWKNPWWIIN